MKLKKLKRKLEENEHAAKRLKRKIAEMRDLLFDFELKLADLYEEKEYLEGKIYSESSLLD
jgi:chromosome segregation ATPase